MEEIESDVVEAEPQVSDLTPETEPQTKSASEVAKEVVAGHWGRGNARVKRLSDAGFDPDEVLSEVDKIFGR